MMMANRNAIQKLSCATKYRNGYAKTGAPIEATIMHGRRPILSDRFPTNGMTITATMLPMTETRRYCVVVNPTPYAGFVANAVPNVTTVVGTTFISAMQATRAMFPPLSVNADLMGDCGIAPCS